MHTIWIVACHLVFTGPLGLASGSNKQGLVYVGDMGVSVCAEPKAHNVVEGGSCVSGGAPCLRTLDVQTESRLWSELLSPADA